MKYSLNFVLVSAFALPIVTSFDVSPRNEEETVVLQFFSMWRNGENLPILLPPLDIITIPPLNGSYVGKGVKINYSSSELRLSGVNNFTVVKLNVALRPATLRASGELSLPTLKIFTECYELNGKAFYVYSLKGSGKLDIILNGVNLQFSMNLARNGSGSRVVDMKLDFSITDIKASLENSSWPINKLLNNEGVKILEGYHEELITATRARLIGTFDDYLAGVTPTQLLEGIQIKNRIRS